MRFTRIALAIVMLFTLVAPAAVSANPNEPCKEVKCEEEPPKLNPACGVLIVLVKQGKVPVDVYLRLCGKGK